MAQASLATVFSLSGVSATTSAKCLQWTADGQLLVLTKSAVHIMTPHIGMSGEVSSTIDRTEEKNSSSDVKRIGWLRTMIGIDKALDHQWPTGSQEWGAVALGSLDQGVRAVTSSPSNLSGDASCLLVVLNSNMELALWGPVKNFLSGEWTKLVDVTEALQAHFSTHEDSTLASILRAQSTCIEWSSQADFGLAPTPLLDGSLLAVGNRAGSVSFLRFRGRIDGSWEVCCAATVPLADRWVTHVAWSSWKRLQGGGCEASLACGIADGSVVVLRVIQTVHPEASPSGLVPHNDIQASFEVRDIKPSGSDGRGLTCMRWAEPSADLDMLIYSKPGKLYLWAMPANGHLSILRTVALPTQQLSIGSSALTPVVGLTHVDSEDALVVCLADGSFHVVHHLSKEQSSVQPPNDVGLSSIQLSTAGRSAFAAAETEKTTKKDVNRIYGMVSYDSHAWFTWLHDYRHDARHACMLVIARLPSRESPLSLLRPTLLYLQDENILGLCGRLLDSSPNLRSECAGLVRSLGAHILRTADLKHDRQAFAELSAHCDKQIQSRVQLAIFRSILSSFVLMCLLFCLSDCLKDADYEPCPACHAQIPFQDAATAECPQGHVWTRCSVTSYIIATPVIRACSSCNRKAFFPLQRAGEAGIPDDIRKSWLAADVLNAAQRCLRCGCNFVMLL
ncbi:transcription factor IIIC subunit delta N-term-domain-containing protein [Fomitopsis serialis]|uniref:transcription factor IIIC subunit delta N-term-domain-containing protein n=1 Tax=Fomitopsis serialis TaxID=139415 RepID=UPI002007F84B|nr:transcription factor IIIC subunit delta N-term-domain-containing protein [Neoantrodia serialis]KAH9933377.1 transcription factor IIIC subunit delta N-term-domain-containing protein [Neoantrodia serialis]